MMNEDKKRLIALIEAYGADASRHTAEDAAAMAAARLSDTDIAAALADAERLDAAMQATARHRDVEDEDAARAARIAAGALARIRSGTRPGPTVVAGHEAASDRDQPLPPVVPRRRDAAAQPRPVPGRDRVIRKAEQVRMAAVLVCALGLGFALGYVPSLLGPAQPIISVAQSMADDPLTGDPGFGLYEDEIWDALTGGPQEFM